MLDAEVLTKREKYQKVVEATAEIRAWGIEWLLCYGVQFGRDGGGPDTLERRKVLIEELELAQKMLRSEFDVVFIEELDGMPAEVELTRKRASNSLTQSLENFKHMQSNDTGVTPGEILELANYHVDKCGQALSDFLAILNNVLSKEEEAQSGGRVSLIQSAVNEIDNINMMINLIAVNASVEAAHAGVAGKGFSVIAAEIQNLSQKSRSVFDELQRRLKEEDKKSD